MLDATRPTPAAAMTAAELARESFLSWYPPNTREAYGFDLAILFDWCADQDLDPFAVTRLDLERFVRHLIDKRGNGPATVRRRVACIRRFYRLAAHDGHLPVSPADYVRIPRALAAARTELDLGLDRYQLAALLAAAKASSAVDAALVALLALMGLRVSEACALTVDNAHDVENGHRVLRYVGKGNKPATAPIAVPVWRLLEQAIGGRTSGPLLLRPNCGQPHNRVSAARAVRRLAAAAGIERRVTPHDLRRGYISGMLDAGVSLRDAQTAARHADPRMTMRYDRARLSLDRHGNYVLATWISGAA